MIAYAYVSTRAYDQINERDFALHRRSYSLTRYNIVVCIKGANIGFTLLFLDKVSFSIDADILSTNCFGRKLICLIHGNKALTVGERLCISCRRIRKEILVRKIW